MSLARWDPFRDLVTLREAMERLFEESFVRPQSVETRADAGGRAFAMDMYETDDEVVVEALLPGFKAEDVDIEFQNNVLTLQAEHEEERTEEEATYHLRERRYGRFFRRVAVPTEVNPDKAEAVFEDGVLKLRLPKAEVVKPKKIKAKAKVSAG